MVLLRIENVSDPKLTTSHYKELISRWRPGAGSVSIIPSPDIPLVMLDPPEI